MPNAKPIIRAMDWGLLLKSLPDEISCFLPKGDPLSNKEKIKQEIERLKFGPEVRYQMYKYTKGEITEKEFENNIDKIISMYDVDELEKLNQNLSTIENCLKPKTYEKYLPFFKTVDLKSPTIKTAVKNIKQTSFIHKNKNIIKENS